MVYVEPARWCFKPLRPKSSIGCSLARPVRLHRAAPAVSGNKFGIPREFFPPNKSLRPGRKIRGKVHRTIRPDGTVIRNHGVSSCALVRFFCAPAKWNNARIQPFSLIPQCPLVARRLFEGRIIYRAVFEKSPLAGYTTVLIQRVSMREELEVASASSRWRIFQVVAPESVRWPRPVRKRTVFATEVHVPLFLVVS